MSADDLLTAKKIDIVGYRGAQMPQHRQVVRCHRTGGLRVSDPNKVKR